MTDQSGVHLGRQRSRLTATITDFDVERQRALLIGVVNDQSGVVAGEQSLAELELLTDTAGSEPVESVLLRRDRFNAATLVIGVSVFLDNWLARPLTLTASLDDEAANADRALREENSAAGLAAALRGLGQGACPYVGDRLGDLAMPP